MKVRILGCGGGIGDGQHTSSMLVDDDILLDAGTGVATLGLAELVRIDHVFITHSHLDHIACLPLLVEAAADMRGSPITVHAPGATLEALRRHVFNWSIWPDFTAISVGGRPAMQYAELAVGTSLQLGARRVGVLPSQHAVPAVGYLLDSGTASLAFTGDTGSNPELWPVLNATANLRYLVIETAFSDRDAGLAHASRHLCPELLVRELGKLERDIEVFVSHIKPGQGETIMSEIAAHGGRCQPQMLRRGHVFDL